MNISENDIKLWLGELFLEVCLLRREVARLIAELEIKNELLKNMSSSPKQGEGKEKETRE